MHKAFRYRLEPNAEQREKLNQFVGARRFIWNWALQQRRDHYRKTGKTLPMKELSKRLTALKQQPETAWLREMHAQALQQALTDLYRAYTNFFERRARYPRFKSKKTDRPRFRMPQDVRVSGEHITVPKMGRVRVRLSRPVEGTTKSATFTQDVCGHWHVSFVSEIDNPSVVLPLPPLEQTVGVDLGLKDIVVCSNGYREPAPRFYRRGERTLRRAQRVHSRRKKGSHNRQKARARLARLQQHVANQRANFLHNLTTKLVKQHAAISTEDLSIHGLARTKLAKSVQDAGMGALLWQLAYKGQWYGTHVVAVDRFYPSTQLCHDCGFQNHALTLADRTWACPACGVLHDRDLNAALNIRAEGWRILAVGYPESLNACGADVRPATAGRPC